MKSKIIKIKRKKSTDILTVKSIASKMEPIDERKLKLPRSFAHTLRSIIEIKNSAE